MSDKQNIKPALSPMSAFFLVGATACGKTSVAQWLSEKYGYEILSADSMLVYKDMDIGTAKPTESDRAKVNYHGIDLVPPNISFNAWRYRQNAVVVAQDCLVRKKKLLVVGGTGLYIKSLTDGLTESLGPDDELRRRWSDLLDAEGVCGLQRELMVKDPLAYEALADKQNPRRIIRALENISTSPPRASSDLSDAMPSDVEQNVAPLVGLTMPADDLIKRIEVRVDQMYRDDLQGEVRYLVEKYGEFSKTALQAIGYAEVLALQEGRCSLKDAKEKTIVRTRRLAKRQRTWFKNQADVQWIEIENDTKIEDVGDMVQKAWSEYGPTIIHS